MEPAQDLAGVTCTDDSMAGSRRQDQGDGRKAALTYWRWDMAKNHFVSVLVHSAVSV